MRQLSVPAIMLQFLCNLHIETVNLSYWLEWWDVKVRQQNICISNVFVIIYSQITEVWKNTWNVTWTVSKKVTVWIHSVCRLQRNVLWFIVVQFKKFQVFFLKQTLNWQCPNQCKTTFSGPSQDCLTGFRFMVKLV